MTANDIPKGFEQREERSGSSGRNHQNLIAANASAGLNRLAGFNVTAAENGAAEIVMEWNDHLTQYAGHLHAGMIAALLDTACGFAAATVAGSLTATHFSMNCLRPAVGRRLIAKGTTVRAGRKQIFAKAELFTENDQGERSLVATGDTLMVPVDR
jgi:uncharacterized protein (TIGR00369 family)